VGGCFWGCHAAQGIFLFGMAIKLSSLLSLLWAVCGCQYIGVLLAHVLGWFQVMGASKAGIWGSNGIGEVVNKI